jgi:hypothetical protein
MSSNVTTIHVDQQLVSGHCRQSVHGISFLLSCYESDENIVTLVCKETQSSQR